MVAYATTKKTIRAEIDPADGDGSLADAISDYLNTIENSKTIRHIQSFKFGQQGIAIIIHDA